jgi:hypothetical protein
MNIFKLSFVFIVILCIPFLAVAQDGKINGMSMVASKSTIDVSHAESLKQLGSNYVAVMPYAFMPEANTPKLIFDTKRQWSGETIPGIESDISTLQDQGLQIMIKPHIWVAGGIFTGDISMSSEEEWQHFEENYRSYILTFVKLAEQNKVSMFCLGTELEGFVSQRPEFWCELIQEVRALYSGKLTYAENWDKYHKVHFWDSLDFIGIDGYFPVSNSKTPSLSEVNLAFRALKKELKSFSKLYQRKILLTEYGYRSVDYAGKEPWDSSRNENPVNEKAQLNLLQGLHQSFWKEDWFAGGFLWKWFPNYDPTSKRHQNRFTIQGKISEDYTRSFYLRQ